MHMPCGTAASSAKSVKCDSYFPLPIHSFVILRSPARTHSTHAPSAGTRNYSSGQAGRELEPVVWGGATRSRPPDITRTLLGGVASEVFAVGAAAPSVSAISGAFHSPRDSSLTREESTGLARPLHLGSSPSRRMAEAPARLFQPVTLLCARPLRGPRNPLHFCFFPPFAD